LLENAIEEFNRLDPAVTFLFRVANADVKLGDVAIKAGDTVFVANHAVNRDPEVFSHPDECQLDRDIPQHFAYGYGPHYCLGAKLARIQMKSLFSNMLKRWPEMTLESNDPSQRNHYSLAFSGFHRLPVVLRGQHG